MTPPNDTHSFAAAELAHEMRNIALVVRAIGESLRSNDAVNRQELDDLVTCAERIEALARRTMHPMAAHDDAAPPDLALVIAQQLGRLRRLVPPDVDLSFDHESTPLRATLPLRSVEQMVTNLVLNALDAMPHGGRLRIEVRSVAAMGGRRMASLTVRDTGVGMNEPTLRRCSEAFFTTKGPRGTGLGLYSVCRGVESAGGRVAIDSVIGTGTTVSLLLPLHHEGPRV